MKAENRWIVLAIIVLAIIVLAIIVMAIIVLAIIVMALTAFVVCCTITRQGDRLPFLSNSVDSGP